MEQDIFHEGKGDDKDDHKLINERLLEVAIPQETRDGRPIRLEDCLEEYFNTRVDVFRKLDTRNILKIPNGTGSPLSIVDEKGGAVEHVERVDSPIDMTPTRTTDEKKQSTEVKTISPYQHVPENAELDAGSRSITPAQPSASPVNISRPSMRHRSTSIIRHVTVKGDESGEGSAGGDTASTHSSMRKTSSRREFLMPAWQFFRIIRPPPIYSYLSSSIPSEYQPNQHVLIGDTAWYTAQIPQSDAQIANFASTRPILGICLKRYAMSSDGQPIRQNTPVDIPLQISLPHFIRDDKATDDAPPYGNFNMVLQSVVCHRGESLHSGHYITLIRGTAKKKDKEESERPSSSDSSLPEYSPERWIKFDDLARERVTYVDIEKALVEEMPYLLFYQVQPICPDEPPEEPSVLPPSYQDSGVVMKIKEATPVLTSIPDPFPPPRRNGSYFEVQFAPHEEPPPARVSFSDDVDRPRNSLNLPDASRRGSVAFTDTSASTVPSAPVTPNEEAAPFHSNRLSRAISRVGRGRDKSKSRASSQPDENRMSVAAFAKLSMANLVGNRSSKEFSRVLDSGSGSSSNEVGALAVNSPAVHVDGPPLDDRGLNQWGERPDRPVVATTTTEIASVDLTPQVSKQPGGVAEFSGTGIDTKWKKEGKGKAIARKLSMGGDKDRDRECGVM